MIGVLPESQRISQLQPLGDRVMIKVGVSGCLGVKKAPPPLTREILSRESFYTRFLPPLHREPRRKIRVQEVYYCRYNQRTSPILERYVGIVLGMCVSVPSSL